MVRSKTKAKKTLREEMIGISCTKAEKKQIEQAAEKMKMTISAYARWKLLVGQEKAKENEDTESE